MGLPSGRAFHVSASTVPLSVKPAPCWKFFTAISTSGPKMSSTVSSRFGVGAMHAGGVVPQRPWRQARSLVAPDSTCPYLLTFDISSLTRVILEPKQHQVAPDRTHCLRLLIYPARDCRNRHERPPPSESPSKSRRSNQISLSRLYRHFERFGPLEWNSE
jgi:hypothetical protein